MKLESEVQKVRISETKYVLGFSNSEYVTVFNQENESTFTCKPGHTSCSIKSAQIDPEGSYIATTGTDGYLNIYKIDASQNSALFLTKV